MPYSMPKLLSAIHAGFGGGRQFLKVCDLIGRPQAPGNAAILRFDVERALRHQVKMAERLSSAGISGTFYFHTRRECYDPEMLRTVEGLGHEVGYHHECLDRCRGNFDQARELFLREVDIFRKDRLELLTVCSHGEAGLRKNGFRSNLDLFERFPDLLSEAGLRGEVYLWLRNVPAFYASDTFRSYSKWWATLTEARSDPSKPLMILTHLHRWRSNPLATMFEVSRDLLRQVSNRVRHKRGYRLAYR